MRKLYFSLAATVLGVFTYVGFTSTVQAADVPNYDQLYQQSQQQATDEVTAKLANQTLPDADQLRQQAMQQATQPSSSDQRSSNQSGTDIPEDAMVIVLNTGDNVDLDTSNQQSSSTSVTNNNDATINQTVNGSANTGGNTANRNISIGGNAGTIQTGSATVNGSASATANNNTTAITGSCQNVVSNATIYNTGNNLDHQTNTSNTCTTTVTNNNTAVINQVVNGNATTGNNQANRNIAIGGGSAGQIVTGNTSVGSMVTTDANHNQIVIVGGQSRNGGPGAGANIYYIVNTANNADLSAYYRRSTATSVSNTNTYVGNQVVNSTANTGGNTANRNINQNGDAGVIQTGNATVNTVLTAKANANTTSISGSGGNATTNVNIINTGDNLHSDTDTSVSNTTTVTNTNTAIVNQAVNATANTGNNQANRNIAFNGDAGRITTGDATINTAINADVNRNQTVISGAEGQANSHVNVLNTGNNAQISTNDTADNTIEVTNVNTAIVNQAVNADATTGNNTANRNIGDSSITTGNVTVNSNVISNANGSYTFIIDSQSTGMDVFNQFLQYLLGQNLSNILDQCHCSTGTVTSPGGDATTAVVNTGDNTTVLASNTSVRTVTVSNNNNAAVNQTVNVAANTGNNTCSRNSGSCDIVTGDVVVTTTLVVDTNWNFTIIGNVGGPTPVQPETPTEPETTPETSQEQPKADSASQTPAVLAAVTSNQPATLPNTGAANAGWIGLMLITGGALLSRKRTLATVKA